MALALFKPKIKTAYPTYMNEPVLTQVRFTPFKFNNRPKPPDRSRILLICCFSEFGCETIGCTYCIPRLIKRFPGKYIIGVGWYGREYLYRHLLDEFWEIDESCMWLRDHCYAFHHLSRNLKNIEQSISIHGSSVPSSMLGKYVIGCYCNTCGKTWNEWRQVVTNCPSCTSTAIINSIFADVDQYKNTAVKIPRPSKENLEWAKSFIKPNTVGIFARGRKTYGRNLPKEYYVQLIHKLQSQGYNIVWLGEKQSTQPCPVEGIFDFSRENESRDLEKTLAIICHLEFTIQFWTASSRLAALMGVPYILFESPDQIFTSGILPGQEGRRLELLTFGPKKIVLSDFLNVLDDFDGTLNLLDQAILELKNKNYDHLIGMVDYPDIVRKMADE